VDGRPCKPAGPQRARRAARTAAQPASCRSRISSSFISSSRRRSILPAIYRETTRQITLVKDHNMITLDLDAWEFP